MFALPAAFRGLVSTASLLSFMQGDPSAVTTTTTTSKPPPKWGSWDARDGEWQADWAHLKPYQHQQGLLPRDQKFDQREIRRSISDVWNSWHGEEDERSPTAKASNVWRKRRRKKKKNNRKSPFCKPWKIANARKIEKRTEKSGISNGIER